MLEHPSKRNVPVERKPLDYYSILIEAIQKTEQNSAQLRALVYERVRFNLKREALFGYSSMGLAGLVDQINELEYAIARIEANSTDGQPSSAYREQLETLGTPPSRPGNAVQVISPAPTPPMYAGYGPIREVGYFQPNRRPDGLGRYLRSAIPFIGMSLLGTVIIGIVLVADTLWHSPTNAPHPEIASKLPQANSTNATSSSSTDENRGSLADSTSKSPFPLPSSFGVYVLNDNKLTELEALPINIPDPRVALSAEIKKPSAIEISDAKPAFILFRRDLLNNAPQKITLRVIARMARETKIVGGKAMVTNIEGIWRIRNISRELNVSPIAGQREMVIARADDNGSLAPGRYSLVLNRVGYDFTIKGPIKSLEFCLEGFETANGSVFSQCRAP